MPILSTIEKSNPYGSISPLKRARLSLLEGPSGVLTLVNHKRIAAIPKDKAQEILTETLGKLPSDKRKKLNEPAVIDSFLGRGYEASVFSFHSSERKWVMKVGLTNPPVVGLLPPSTDSYAAALKWNHAVLTKAYGPSLPFAIPSDYFVLAPSELECDTTIQLLPFTNRFTDLNKLTHRERDQLIEERTLFYAQSLKAIKKYGVMPDLVGANNLILGQTNEGPHYTLIDVGVFNLMAPTPLLNIWVFLSQHMSFVHDTRALKKKSY